MASRSRPVPSRRAVVAGTERCGEFAPHWIYPAPAHIERHATPYPLSVDTTRLARLKQDLAHHAHARFTPRPRTKRTEHTRT